MCRFTATVSGFFSGAVFAATGSFATGSSLAGSFLSGFGFVTAATTTGVGLGGAGFKVDFANTSICIFFCFGRAVILVLAGHGFVLSGNNVAVVFSIGGIIKSASTSATATGCGSVFFSGAGAGFVTAATVGSSTEGLSLNDNLATSFSVSRLLNSSVFLKSFFLF